MGAKVVQRTELGVERWMGQEQAEVLRSEVVVQQRTRVEEEDLMKAEERSMALQ
jgi:hypothetical protein